jgi:Na+/H+ antiporter NhaB
LGQRIGIDGALAGVSKNIFVAAVRLNESKTAFRIPMF